MAAELKGKTAATKQARKALLRQIYKAQAPLQSKHVADSGVHGARKQIKMARATLRLLRKGLSQKAYRAQNERLRDAAKPLSEARDATVLLSTFDDLLDGQGRNQGGNLKAFHDELTHERARTRSKILGDGGLADSRRLLRRWSSAPDSTKRRRSNSAPDFAPIGMHGAAHCLERRAEGAPSRSVLRAQVENRSCARDLNTCNFPTITRS